jgi:5-methylcytosine-specific restriction endonuclease McrA
VKGGILSHAVKRFIDAGLSGDDLVEAVRRLEKVEGLPRDGTAPRASLAQQYNRAIEAIRANRIPPGEKRRLLARCIAAFGSECQYCDQTGTPSLGPDGRSWHIDRIFPGALGGRYEADNITLACRACNHKKGALIIYRKPLSLAAVEAGEWRAA